MKISTIYQKFLGVIALLLFTTQVAWAAWPAYSGTISGSGDNYYVLDDATERSISATGSGGNYTYQLGGPSANLSFKAKRDATGVGSLTVGQNSGDQLFDKNPGKVTKKIFGIESQVDYDSYGTYAVNANSTQLVFSASLGSYKKYFKDVKVTMAKILKDPSKTSIAFTAGKVDDANSSDSFTIDWCNLPAMTVTKSGTGNEYVSVSIDNNSSKGKFGTATFTVTYDRSQASTLDVTLTIKDGNGGNSKTVKVTGSTAKYNQTLSWVNESSILPNMFIGGHQAIMAVGSPSGLNATSFSSNNTNALTVSDAGVLTAIAAGEATITAYQAGNYKYNPASTTYDFVVKPKATPTINPVGFSEGTTELKVDDVRTINLADVSAGLDGDFTVTASTADVMGITREGNTITLTALHAGATTLTVKQTENSTIYGAEKSYTFNVTRYTPEFTLSATNLALDDTATLTLNHVDGVSIEFSNDNVGYDAGVITAKKAGTTTLTVTQPETNSIEAREAVYTITVVKKTPTLTVKMNGAARTALTVYQGETVALIFDQVSDGVVTVEPVNGGQYATYSDGVLHASSELGTATFRANLSETDTYAATSVQFTLTVQKDNRHLPITMSSDLWNNSNFKVASEGKNSWDGSKGIVLGHTTDDGTNWDDRYVILHFEGIPDKLTFDIATDACSLCQALGGATKVEWYVQESTNTTFNAAKIWTSTADATSFSSHTVQLAPTTRYIKLCYSGNFGGDFRNVRISELKYVQDPEPASVDFGSKVINSGEVSKEVNINWCNIAPLTVTSSNPRFTVSPSLFGNYEQLGSQTITISYTHTNEVGANEGDITISNGTAAYNKTIHVTATTTKRPQSITWNAELSATNFAMNVGEQYPDIVIPVVATATSNERVTFTSSDPDIIEVVADTALLAKAIGDVTITAHQAGNAEYDAVDAAQAFVVTNKRKQSIVWDQNLYGLLTTSGSVELTATATSGGEIIYTSANTSIVSVSGNVLTVVGEGETYITATQAGFEDAEGEWLGVTATNYVIVRDPASQCNEMALSVGVLTLNSSNSFTKEYTLSGTPTSLSFTAKHGEKSKGAWFQDPTYAPLLVEQYAKKDGVWGWYQVYNNVVGTDNTASGTVGLDETATKIRFRALETGTDHTINNIRIARKKYMRTNVSSVDETVECNAIWQQEITISHSNIDFMSVSSKRGLVTLSTATLGEGCGDYGDDSFVASYTPTVKETEYKDTIIVTDNKAEATTLEIPVRLYAQGFNQTINGFELPAAAVATDEIAVNATASSTLPVTYTSSDESIAYVQDGQLVILSDGTVTITASQEGNDKYNAATPVAQTIVISKTPVSITTVPTAAAITYGQSLSASELTNGEASVEGTFAWAAPETTPESGSSTYTVNFTPTQSGIYASANTLVTLTINKATPVISTWPTASDITIAQALSDATLTGGSVDVEGNFAWKNPTENRLKPGEYQRTVVFTPTNNNYNSVEELVNVTVVNVLAKITENPTAVAANPIYGITLADVELQGGAANVAGAFSWADEATVPTAGTHDYAVVFTPEDLELYSAVNLEVSLTIGQAPTTVTTAPTATAISFGEAIGTSTLEGGEGSMPGSFAWADATIVPDSRGEHSYAVIFTPDDPNFATSTADVTVTVNKATAQIITIPVISVALEYGQTLEDALAQLSSGLANVPGTFTWEDATIAPKAGVREYTVIFTPDDTENYEPTTTTVSVTINQAPTYVVTKPNDVEMNAGKSLSTVELVGGVGSMDGTFVWANGDLKPTMGEGDYDVLFVPSDENFANASTTVHVVIIKGIPEVRKLPTANANGATYGVTLADVTLSGGYATVQGSFAWEDATIKPTAGTHKYNVVFSPSIANSDEFGTTTCEVSVTIGKATPEIIDLPTAYDIEEGDRLEMSWLGGGEATTEGAFEWKDVDLVPEQGTSQQTVVFVPTDLENYNMVEALVEVIVKAKDVTTDLNEVEEAGALKAIYSISGQLITNDPANFIPTQGTYIFLYEKGVRKVTVQ